MSHRVSRGARRSVRDSGERYAVQGRPGVPQCVPERAPGPPRLLTLVVLAAFGIMSLGAFAPEPVGLALETADGSAGRAAVEGITQGEALATIALGARTAQVREAALERLAAVNAVAHAVEAGGAVHLVHMVRSAFAGVPEEHRIRLMAALLPAIEMLADPEVAGVVGELRSLQVAWTPRTMAYSGHTLAGEQFTCTLGLSRPPDFLVTLWSSRFPVTLTVRFGQLAQRFVPAEPDMDGLLRPVLDRLTPETVAGIARDKREALIRQAAAAGLTDQGLLLAIAREDRAGVVRRAAVAKLADQALLAGIAGADPDPTVRLAAVEKILDQELLAGIALADTGQEVREAALGLLTDQRLLARVASAEGDPAIRRRAVEQVTDREVLAGIAASGADPEVRRAAVERLTDQSLLAGLAWEDSEEEVRLAAVEGLTDQDLLARIAVTDASQWVREGAVLKLTDRALLARIAVEDRNNRVRQSARERLEELRQP